MKTSINVKIIGRVQGVWFRVSTQKKALQLNIKGWVKNASDGSVEACFQSDQSTLKQMVRWCHKGPEMAQVEKVITTRSNEPEHHDFKIR